MIDPITAALSKVSIDAGLYLSKSMIGKVVGLADKVKNEKDLNTQIKEYLESTAKRCALVKTMFDEQPVQFRSIYEPVGVKKVGDKDSTNISEREILWDDDLSRVVITDTQGAGKSMFMRSLFLFAVEWRVPGGRLPIFCDLKKFNTFKDYSLNALVAEAFEPYLGEGSRDFATGILRKGNVFLILDGFDEIDPSIRRDVIVDILRKSDVQGSKIFLSSRYNEHIDALDNYVVFEIDDIDLEKAKAIIRRVKFDEDEKTEFIEVLESRLFAEYNSIARHDADYLFPLQNCP